MGTLAAAADLGCSDRYERRSNAVLKPLDSPVIAQEGQTTPEYAVVLSVLTITAAAVFIALSGGVANAIASVTGIL